MAGAHQIWIDNAVSDMSSVIENMRGVMEE